MEGRVHFGEHTHWKLRLLSANLPWIWDARAVPPGGVALAGEDNSWALPVFPLPGATVGTPTPGHAHFDGGRHNGYHRDGLPCRCGTARARRGTRTRAALGYKRPPRPSPSTITLDLNPRS